jgi:hypothetical protein
MAAALISITGTSGKVSLNYIQSAVAKSAILDIGTLFLDDAAVTNVTYTTISGDAIASSLVFTITNLPYQYYKLEWKGLKSEGYKIKNVLLGVDTFNIPEVTFPESGIAFINSVNDLNNDNLKITDYKFTTLNLPLAFANVSFIFRILGNDVPELEIRNIDDTGFIYVKGVPTAYPVVGYTTVSLCNNLPL